ncbi:hypothetical protein ACWGIU_05240 [Streptomyces sp. NPDC054840]
MSLVLVAAAGAPQGLADALEHGADGYLRLVDASRVGAEEASRLLREAVQGARAAGHSRETVGRIPGVSRQAARRRFAGASVPGVPTCGGPGAAERRILGPLTGPVKERRRHHGPAARTGGAG